MPQVEFKVGMTCEGCANAVKRILGKLEGVTAVQTVVADKRVSVESSGVTSAEDMLAALKKWGDASGKSVELA